MSFVDDLLAILTSYSGGYRVMRSRIRGMPSSRRSYEATREIKETTLRATLARLRKLGLVENRKGIWALTEKGRRYLRGRKSRFVKLHGKYPSTITERKKNMIIAFDVPEPDKRKREWLRAELRCLGFTPIQKSVWFGPSPLPGKFLENLSELDILSCVKFFRATEEDVV
jgi:DNA-binding transcriptional regulator PaaX